MNVIIKNIFKYVKQHNNFVLFIVIYLILKTFYTKLYVTKLHNVKYMISMIKLYHYKYNHIMFL